MSVFIPLQGDCRKLLQQLEENSVDALITDPPYGIGFMGQKWDTFKPGKETKRVVQRVQTTDNPNVRGRSRSPASSPSAVEYDRSLSGQREFQEWTASWASHVLRVLKPGGHGVVCGAPRSYHRMACGLEDAGFEIRDCLMWLFGQGFPKSLNLGKGMGTALKPAWEPIVLVRKPTDGSITANVGEWGTGGLAIDACRVDHAGAPPKGYPNGPGGKSHHYSSTKRSEEVRPNAWTPSDTGRWPANLLLDESAGQLLDAQTGELKSGTAVGGLHRRSNKTGNCYGVWKGRRTEGDVTYGDSGGASRFFYCPKVSTKEREFGCDHLPLRTPGDMTGGRKEGSKGLKNPRAGAGRGQGSHNAHPTVKPLALMRWLVKLITPPEGIIVDPFIGSGSTAIAGCLEGHEVIGMDLEREWLTVAEARVKAWLDREEA